MSSLRWVIPTAGHGHHEYAQYSSYGNACVRSAAHKSHSSGTNPWYRQRLEGSKGRSEPFNRAWYRQPTTRKVCVDGLVVETPRFPDFRAENFQEHIIVLREKSAVEFKDGFLHTVYLQFLLFPPKPQGLEVVMGTNENQVVQVAVLIFSSARPCNKISFHIVQPDR